MTATDEQTTTVADLDTGPLTLGRFLLHDVSTWTLADMVGVAQPDSIDSAGAQWLQSVKTEVVDYVDEVCITYGGDAADVDTVLGELYEQARSSDLAHDRADELANLIYTDAITRTVSDLHALHWGHEYLGAQELSDVMANGSGQYPAGPDAVGVLCLYHLAERLFVELLDQSAHELDELYSQALGLPAPGARPRAKGWRTKGKG